MSNHSSHKKGHRKKKNLIDRFFDSVFGHKHKKRKHLPSSRLEREDFEVEFNAVPNEGLALNTSGLPVDSGPISHEDEKASQDKSALIKTESEILEDENERRKHRREEYLKEWGIEEDKGFFASLIDKKKVRKSNDSLILNKPISARKYRKKSNRIDSFFNKFFRKQAPTEQEIQLKKLKESRKKKKELKKRKQFFLKRLRKRKNETGKKGNWFTRLFSLKPKDPFLKEQDSSPSIFREFLKTKKYNYFIINSLFLFLTAYIVVYLIYQFTVLMSASMWDLDSVLYYWDLAFDDYSPKWNKWNIIAITFSGPFISLVTGILFLKVLFNFESLHVSHRLFILWIALHGINRFLGAFVAGVITDEGFGYVVNWMYIPEFYKILFVILALFLMGVIGYYTARQFLDVSGSYHFIRKTDHKAYLLSQALLPSVLGSIILFIIKMPYNPPYETIMLGSFLFMTVPVIFNFRAKPTPVYTNEKLKQKFYFKYFLWFLLLLIFYRIVLDPGLHFEINIDINISNAKYFKF